MGQPLTIDIKLESNKPTAPLKQKKKENGDKDPN